LCNGWLIFCDEIFEENLLTLYYDIDRVKKSLHEQIDGCDDIKLLRKIEKILSSEKVFIIPEYMMEGIRQGEEDIRNGNFLTLEEFEKRYEKYLKP
jgi:hypothetical protein